MSPNIIIVIAVICGLGVLMGLLFYGLIFPIWTLVDCATSENIPNQSKTIWIVIIFFLWSLGAIVYGLFVSPKTVIRKISRGSLFLMVVCAVAFFMSLPKINSLIDKQVTKGIPPIDQISMPNVPESEKMKIKSNLEILRQEANASWHLIQKKQVAWDLLTLFDLFIKDGELTNEEYTQWRDKFGSRTLIEPKALRKFVRDLKLSSRRRR